MEYIKHEVPTEKQKNKKEYILTNFKGKIFHFFISSRPALGPTQPPIQWVLGAVSPEGRAAGA
jgi:hypothetical protein